MRVTRLFQEFTNSEKSGGIVLLFCTIISLIIANTTFGDPYIHFWHSRANLSFAFINLDYSVEEWINDGLMTIFFVLVGLEIEREIYEGELSDIKNAILPIAAAIGGMLVPAAIHFLLNRGTETQSGYGIPMATDIAFALGMLALLGKRVPHSLKIFLTALAIIDDLGAIMVIAIFYSSGISALYLGLALGIFGLLLVFNRMKMYILSIYIFFGIIMWYCMLQSGVHATITGVLFSFALPFNKEDGANNISNQFQHFLHKPVAFVILPIFALANTGIILTTGWQKELLTRNSLGIMLGLLIGKPIGITLFSWIAAHLKLGILPQGIQWKHLFGAGIFGGIGFTMSIFITNLAFANPEIREYSKISILLGTLIATICGLVFLFLTTRKKERKLVKATA